MLLVCLLVSPTVGSTGEQAAGWLRARGVSPELVVLLIATLPIVELRGAVPVGIIVLGLPWWQAVLWSLVGNIAPIVVVLLLLERLVKWLSRIPFFRRFFDWLYARALRRSGAIQRYEFWGLVTFVGIPLPMTGAWTGAVAAKVLRLSYWRSLVAIIVGVVMAAVVVTFVSVLGRQFRWVGIGLVVLIVGVFVLAVVNAIREARARRQP
ncbi:MAG: small multi-drug export protein [candidate division WOR-3 bacterium]